MGLNIKSFALAAGILLGAAILLVGIGNIMFPGYGSAFLKLVASVYPGYVHDASYMQVLFGSAYGFVDGVIGGAIFAWLYNRLL